MYWITGLTFELNLFISPDLYRGIASNEAEEAVTSSLFCVRTRAHALAMSYEYLSACVK